MSHPIFWPRKTFFYPVGNTPAVSLTQDLLPEEPANLLLLGCGDPRSILYTLHLEGTQKKANRDGVLDFTCCDIEVAILARNILIFTLIVDGCGTEQLWNIFYHFKIDADSLSHLIPQCEKLAKLSVDFTSWKNGEYGSWIRYCTEHTLINLREYWLLYANFRSVSKEKLSGYERVIKQVYFSKKGFNLSASRSAGPFMAWAFKMLDENVAHYLQTGIVHSDPSAISAASHINPTFVYSAKGDICAFHYGTYPLQGFHLVEAFIPSSSPSLSGIIGCAQTQFKAWCTSFKEAVTSRRSVIIRFFAGDALAFCQTLQCFRMTGSLTASMYASPWKLRKLSLHPDEYTTRLNSPAPSSFQVIDTSNIMDHVGLLNLLVAVTPLLEPSPSSTLYTEALLGQGADAITGFVRRLCADLPAFSLLFGIAPLGYLAGFNSASNIHEMIRAQAMKTGHNEQYHERICWKVPTTLVSQQAKSQETHALLLNIDPKSLAKLMLEINYNFFRSNEDLQRKLQAPRSESLDSILHYHRGSIVALFNFLRTRVQTDWEDAAGTFLDLIMNDRRLIFNTNFYQELCCYFHIHELCTLEVYNRIPKKAPFLSWDHVPPAVCVALVVPRAKMAVLDQVELNKIGTPILEMSIHDPAQSQNSFSCIQIVIGRVEPVGDDEGSLNIVEDLDGWNSSSSLIAIAWVPSYSLVAVNATRTQVGLSLHGTMTASQMVGTLGPYLSIFSASLMDRNSVHILRERPGLSGELSTFQRQAKLTHNRKVDKMVTVAFDDQRQQVIGMTVRQDITKEEERATLSSNAEVKIVPFSSSLITASAKFGDHIKQFAFPLPIDLAKTRVRVARKSGYIELVGTPLPPAPVPDTLYTSVAPIIFQNRVVTWNVHRLSLSCLPVLGNPTKELFWLNVYVSLAMSELERGLREAGIQKGLPGAADKHVMANVKDTMHTLFMKVHLAKANRIFTLDDPVRGGGYCVIFVNELRIDSSSQTVVVDCYVLPLTMPVVRKIGSDLHRIADRNESIVTTGGEVEAWQYLLPAFTDRCRSWGHKPTCEYLKNGKIPLSTEYGHNPLCRCGQGLDLDDFPTQASLTAFKPYVTRAAISPLFAVSYIQPIARIMEGTSEVPSCKRCGKSKGIKLSDCGGCKQVKYCGPECQKSDWKDHKGFCKAVRS